MRATSTIDVAPTAERDRIELLDVLRGFAVLGIFVVNLTGDLAWSDQFVPATLQEPDRTSLLFVDLFANGKFFTIFSLLFGVGFYIQMTRLEKRSSRAVATYLRRAASLFLIGAVFRTMGFGVTILILYALFSLVLLIFFKRSARTVLIGAAVCLLVPYAFGIVVDIVPEHQEAQEDGLFEATQADAAGAASRRERFFLDSSFAEIVASRLRSGWRMLSSIDFYLHWLDQLGLMLLGCFVARKILTGNERDRLRFCGSSFPWLVLIGALGTTGTVVLKYVAEPLSTSLLAKIAVLLWEGPLGWYALGLGYAAGLTLLFERPKWRRVLLPLRAVGRTALTNYVLQCAVIAFISFGWGLGMYGRMGPFAGLVTALVVFSLQVLASALWLRYFRQGPLEWAWRLMTYGRASMLR